MNRSDFSGVAPVFEELSRRSSAEPILVAGGMHLSERFGTPLQLLAERGISPTHTVATVRREFDTPAHISREIAEISVEVAKIIESEKPDITFILGDRYELVPIALCSFLFGIPIVHHSGGDVTEGSLDNQFRFAVSQFAHLHLVANTTHRDRLLEMGEEPWRIHVVGEPTTEDYNWDDGHVGRLRELLGHQSGLVGDFALVCLHPSPFEDLSGKEMVEALIAGLEHYPGTLLVTPPNQDIGGSDIKKEFEEISAPQRARIRCVQTLGKGLFNAALNHADFIIGNSSAGLLDAAQFQLPAVNLGVRQKGRESGPSVIHLPFSKEEIQAAIQKLQKTSRPQLRPLSREADLEASGKIADVLVGGLDKRKLLNKKILFGSQRWITD
jgi:UDP-hydrolysing UDP-N-acetyl-D-glucosamine 2-epimerase